MKGRSSARQPLAPRESVGEWLEHDPAVAFDPSGEEARSDAMRPPDLAVQSKCLHCGKVFSSSSMIWGTKEGVRALGPIWWCPTPLCDGAGFGYDIFPVAQGEST